MTANDPTTGAPANAPATPDPFPNRVPWFAVAAYIVIAFVLAWLIALPLWLSDGLRTPGAIVLIALMMYTPGAAALIVAFLIQRPRPRPLPEYLGLWPLRPVWRIVGLALAGIFGSILIVVAGVFLAAAFGLVKLDLAGFSGFAATIHALAGPRGSVPIPIGLLVAIQLVMIPFAALINAFATIGEELGWRGWLLPSLRPLGTWPALVLTGAVWGLWHAPVILLGYDFDEPNLFGLAMMVGGCVAYGILIGWLRLRSGSVWPSVFAHGAFNAAGGFVGLVYAAGTTPDLVSSGPLGWVTWIVMAAVIIVLALTGQFRRQPRLVRRARIPRTMP